MIIFVKTQDKERIVQVDCVQYSKIKETQNSKNSLGIIESTITTKHYIICCGRKLGEYASKERCLEIINSFEQEIKDNLFQNTLFFNMPES